jgi:sugar lactone lactonase YvrE
MTSVDVAVPAGAALGECPLWSPDDGRLYWVDIDDRLIHRFDPSAGRDEQRQVSGRPGSLARTTDPSRLLLAVENEAAWFDWEAGGTTPWLRLESAGTGNRLNDGRTDAVGRFWVGSMYERAADRRFTGQLHRIDPDGSVLTVRHNVGVANGLAFDPDLSRMYFADTLHDMVWRYDYEPETGAARNETPFIDFSDLPGRPDGACVDAEGGYWVAAVYGWAVLRFTPDGVLDRTIELPVQAPTMPAFGGSDLRTLFVTSIGRGGSIELSPDQHEAGGLFAIDTGVAGRVEPAFGFAGS